MDTDPTVLTRPLSGKGKINAYLRLIRWHQPVGTLLTLWPAWWSITLASAGWPSLKLLLLFALGAFVIRSAGCIVNDLWDRDIDARVERTRARPLASGEVSLIEASILLMVLLFIGLMIVLELSFTVFALALLAVPMIVAYPLMKRVTWWPQAFLGFTFNLGALMGWAAVTGDVDAPAWLLYAAAICWTLGYDTIYAHQDAADDAQIGVKSTARLFGAHSPRWVTGFYAVTCLFLGLAAVMADIGWPFWLGWILAAAHLAWQVAWLKPANAKRCHRLFRSNLYLGGIVWLAILGGQAV